MVSTNEIDWLESNAYTSADDSVSALISWDRFQYVKKKDHVDWRKAYRSL